MAIEIAHDVLTDPDFLSSFTVHRRVEAIGNNGRSITTLQILDFKGVVAPEGDNKLERTEDYGVTHRTLLIITAARLYDSQNGMQADFVIWNGNRYIVDVVSPYRNYGGGFYQTSCTSTEQLDN